MPKTQTSSKRLIVGCLIAAVVIVIVALAVAVGVYLSVRKVTAPLMYLSGGLRLERTIANTSAFSPPATEELTSRQLDRFLAVEAAVEARLGDRVDLLRLKGEELVGLSRGGTTPLRAAEVLPALGAAGPAYLDAKMAQIDAINKAGLSRDEYEWIRQQAYRAAGIEPWQFEFQDAVAGVADARFEVRRQRHGAAASAASRALVGPHAQKLERWAGLAFFGL